MTRRPPPRAAGEGGDTLIELLITVVILGIAFVGILAGLGTSISLSGRQRGQANADVVVASAAASVQSQAYVACPSATTASYAPTSGVTLPAGWVAANVTVSAIKFRNGSVWQATCPSTDQNVELVTVTASPSDGRASESVDVVKRRAS